MPYILAERFGMGPFYWEDVPADRRERMFNLLGIEGEVSKEYADLGPDDSLSADYFDDDG